MSKYKDKNYFRAYCSIYANGNKKQKFLGHFTTSKEAFYAYKTFKEQYIKEVAEEYKNKIPQKLYEAMYRYEVEIDD